MRIAIALNGFGTGGAERVACGLANHLVKGNEVGVFCVTDCCENPYTLDARVEVYKGQKPICTLGKKVLAFEYNLASWEPSVIVSFCLRTNLLVLNLPRLSRAQIIISERNDPHSVKHRGIRLARRLEFNRARGMVFQTPDAAAFYSWYRGNKAVIPNPVQAPHKASFILDRPKRVIMVNRLEHQKNVLMGIKAFAQAFERDSGYTLSIYGSGSLKKSIEIYINENNLADRVFLEGVTADVYAELDRSRVFLLPSDYEGMPNALLEAMAMGLAVVATDCRIGGPRMIVKDGINGFLVPVKDVDAMTARLEQLASNSDLMVQFSTESIAACDRLKPDMIYKQWDSFITECLSFP